MYTPTIGLEIHAELRTRTKMFCTSKNDPDTSEPNIHICPVCTAHPGTLPTINKTAVAHVLRVGVAVAGTLADYSEFDRKNYFYPDIPKAYQLSQYEFPLVSGGSLADVALTRIHLEEDTARSLHTNDETSSLVDFNRSGVPLMELVTEPVIHSAQKAAEFARELQLLLRTIGASSANLEKGEMRVEANISVAQNKGEFGTKVEVKNLNSFRSVERAIEYEISRQQELLKKGESVEQETRGWDENRGITFSQRAKEEAADYRYFPDPDLPKLKISEIPEFQASTLADTLPELPAQTRARFKDMYALNDETIEIYVFDPVLRAFFERVVAEFASEDDHTKKKVHTVSNYIVNTLLALKEQTKQHVTERITPRQFTEVMALVYAGDVSSNGAVTLIHKYVTGNDTGSTEDARTFAERLGVLQESDESALGEIVATVLREHPDVVADVKAGKEQALQYLVGQGMKLSRGSANPAKLKELLQKEV